jgi:hypothetical protein
MRPPPLRLLLLRPLRPTTASSGGESDDGLALMAFVALATCQRLPEPDADEAALLAALGGLGVDARVVAWDSDQAQLEGARLIVLRSTWNYHLLIDPFLVWVEKNAHRIENPASIVRWNAHKRYLRDLEEEGFPVVPTAWVARGEPCDLGRIASLRGWRDVVVKPAVSAASHATRRFVGPPFDGAFAAELAARADVMVQPYMASVDGVGERSIVCIDGEISHAVRKSPRFAGAEEQVSSGAIAIADDERRLADRVLSRFEAPLLYARIDMMRDESGAPLLGEVELIEPSLFLVQSPGAPRRFAAAIARRANLARLP